MNTIYKILLVVAIGIAAYLFFTRPAPVDLKEYIKIGGKKYELLSKQRDTVYKDTIIYKDVYIPKYVSVPGPEVLVPADVDTTAILKDYYQKYYYEDKITNIDGEGSSATIMDTVSTNRIISRRTKFDITNKTITETITVKEKDKLKVFAGGSFDLNMESLTPQAIEGGFLIKTPKDMIYSVKGGLSNNGIGETKLQPYIGAGLYWKLRFGKKK